MVSSQAGASVPPKPGACGMNTSNCSASFCIAGKKRGEPPLPCSTSIAGPAPARFIGIDAPQSVIVEWIASMRRLSEAARPSSIASSLLERDEVGAAQGRGLRLQRLVGWVRGVLVEDRIDADRNLVLGRGAGCVRWDDDGIAAQGRADGGVED